MGEEQKEILVVGAGPVGLWTALLLAKAGTDVKIVDREARTTTRSYACALHPRTLQLLDQHGLAGELVEKGRKIRTLAFYEGQERKAEVRFENAGGGFPFLLIAPQSALEGALEAALRNAGVAVDWNYRFDSFQDDRDDLVCVLEELGGTATGYIVPHWETVVKNRRSLRTDFLIGADGHKSLVRQRLGADFQQVTGPQFFVAYEFDSDTPAGDEVRVVLDQNTTNVLWPLPGSRYRWTFQVLHSELTEFPEKERRPGRVSQKAVDERMRQYVEKVAHKRAPWFSAGVKEILWCTQVVFEQRLASPLGRGRVWLLGDAAHQTGPVGVQSMNSGFFEAADIASGLPNILRGDAEPESLQGSAQRNLQLWNRLLGLGGGLKARKGISPWLDANRGRILPCLPGLDGDLARLADQLGFDFE
jgi:2-polyprenyl-6-methoxyphenol hydroxylase-like FAD-dependent oxidoreductase